MKRYKVDKWNTNTAECVADYGILTEEDMLLTVRGYKAEEEIAGVVIYSRKGSKWSFLVEYYDTI